MRREDFDALIVHSLLDPAPAVRNAAFITLLERELPGDGSALKKVLVEGAEDLRKAAVAEITLSNDPRAEALLIDALQDSSPVIRTMAAHRLGDTKSIDPVPSLMERIADSNATVRVAVLKALKGKVDRWEQIPPLLLALVHSDDGTRRAARQVLRALDQKHCITFMSRALVDDDHRLWERYEIVEHIWGLEGLSHELRQLLVKRCAEGRDPRCVNLLVKGLSSSVQADVSLAVQALCASHWPRQQVVIQLNACDSLALGRFIQGTSRIGDDAAKGQVSFAHGALELLQALSFDALAKAVTYSDPAVRVIAVWLLSSQKRQDLPGILFKIAFDTDPRVRAIAQDTLRSIDAKSLFHAFKVAVNEGGTDQEKVNAAANWIIASSDDKLIKLLTSGLDDTDAKFRYICAIAVEACKHDGAKGAGIKDKAIKVKHDVEEMIRNRASRSSSPYSGGSSDRAVMN